MPQVLAAALLPSCPSEISCMLGNAVQSLFSWSWFLSETLCVFFFHSVAD